MPLEVTFEDGWKPDLSKNLGGHLVECLNVVPSENGYRPLQTFVASTDALEDTPLGGIAIRNAAGAARFYVATADNIFLLTGSSWANVSPSADFFTTPSPELFDFARYGISTVATNFNDLPHTLVEGVDTSFRQLVNLNDADNWLTGVVPGSPTNADSNFVAPKARVVASIARHQVLGYTNDNQDGISPERVWWSRLGDNSKYIPNVDFLSNFNDLRGGGSVRRIVDSGEYGVVFQEKSVSRMDPGNPTFGFDINEVDQARGALMYGGVIPHGRLVGFIAEDGFFVFDGGGSSPIGVGKVDRTFLRQYDNSANRFVRGIVDPENKVFIWSLPLNSPGGAVNRLFMWSWQYDRWSEAEIALNLPLSAEVGGVVVDDVQFLDTTVDSLNIAVDSAQFKSRAAALGGFLAADNRFAFPSGSPLPAVFETSDIEATPNERTLINSARPRFDGLGEGVFMEIGGKRRPDAEVRFTDKVAINRNGETPSRVNARYHRFRMTTNLNHGVTEFNGFEVPDEAIQPMGAR